MNAKPVDPLRLDVAQLAADGAELEGQWPLADLTRLAEMHLANDEPAPEVQWRVRGELLPVTGGAAEVWLHLSARTELALSCQRCLGPVHEAVHIDKPLRFVPDEAQAAALDAELEDDVLALERALDLRELVEDELLLALPLVPRHETCPQPLPMPADATEAEQKASPFAALAQLKKRG